MTTVLEPKTKLSNAVAYNELEQIRRNAGGILKAEDVVRSAEEISSPLHNYFEWDDSEAAVQWRLQQARQLIRYVVVLPPKDSTPISAYVSLRDDRVHEGGGYRAIAEVMSDEQLREKLLAEAMEDLKHWEMKYQRLTELKSVFEAIAKTRKSIKPRAKR